MASSGPVLVPVQLEAFVLNSAVCGKGDEDDKDARIIPITQPNYTFLRLDNFLLQSDVQNHADLHNTAPASLNMRMSDLSQSPSKPLRHRHGVYLHWILPRFYRVGAASTDAVPDVGQGPSEPDKAADFIQPPTRWLVIRKLDLESVESDDARKQFKEYSGWVIESDHLWALDDIPLDFDLQVDVSPFVVGGGGADASVEKQAEVFIGRKTPLESWSKQADLDRTTPPPNISLLRSSNQLFADFQMHNGNVFSMLDDFRYGKPEDVKYLDKAKASYYLVGWHWSPGADPFFKSPASTHEKTLADLYMQLKTPEATPAYRDPWLDTGDEHRLLCHGAMYDVVWDVNVKPATVPADDFSRRLQDKVVPSISVGTTPMDALISYCTGRKGKSKDSETVTRLEEDILAIYSMLHSRDDGVEGQREAKDTIYNWNFHRAPGGTSYFLSSDDPDGNPNGSDRLQKPDGETQAALHDSSRHQVQLDAANRVLAQYRWDIFALWWAYVSDPTNRKDRESTVRDRDSKYRVDALAVKIRALARLVHQLDTTVKDFKADPRLKLVKSAAMPFFYHGRDPTVLFGGVESGWPVDYTDKVYVRLPAQVVKPEGALPDALQELVTLVSKRLPDGPQDLTAASTALIAEFHTLRPNGGHAGPEPEGATYPQFHDKKGKGRWRYQWGNRQPWFPLFAEWEVEYTHIPFKHWKLDEQTARLSANLMVRYGVSNYAPDDEEKKTETPIWDQIKEPDVRILSGRILILPQPSFSLAAKVEQLFSNTPKALLDKTPLDEEQRQWMVKNLSQLPFLSAPLAGLVDDLLTLSQGSHVKPENKFIAEGIEKVVPLKSALFPDASFTKDNVALIQSNSALTPYAKMARLVGHKVSPFKPVTHGQFRFSKFNIIDKFGQALAVIDQQPRLGGNPPRPTPRPPLYPSISDFYEPQVINCEFIQVPPQINQDARFNAHFVKRTADDPVDPDIPLPAPWRPATEWENLIWGWVLTNYADYGVQLFLPDGTFYREIRFGGPLGASAQPKWIPFARDPKARIPDDTLQLDALAAKLTDVKYLEGFWHMITTAQDKLPPAPGAFAQYLNSIVGKPLALVNMGWSLELSGSPFQNQAAGSQAPEQMLTNYQFQVRLGDRDSEYDGLVGYFDLLNDPEAPPKVHQELDLSNIHTFFALADDNKTPVATPPLNMLTTETYPLFKPYWNPPFDETEPDKVIPAKTYENRRNKQLSVFGAIVDPFTPMHAYSSILPSHTLQLPAWTWQEAMNKMTAFFHAGPLHLAGTVPAYDSSKPLTNENWRDRPARTLGLPRLGAGEWNWLQPYVETAATAGTVGPRHDGGGDGEWNDGDDQPPPPGTSQVNAVFNAFGIEKTGDLTKPGF
ncbi:hypothetical protein F5144DRAFT_650483 [Chaetomium tenue]|uniref:Uncharacterized protein n=1 Tax=Chaetomium tenue TaxID=1854479 RepID=A0ACB7PBE0_9PEZI|nr:hypothetical protein F5144DRAFT_650483 [Chaetomium globosum]